MGVLKKFRVGKRLREFDSYVVNTTKDRANKLKKSIGDKFRTRSGKRIRVRVVKASKGKGYDVFTDPAEEVWRRLKRKWWGVLEWENELREQ